MYNALHLHTPKARYWNPAPTYHRTRRGMLVNDLFIISHAVILRSIHNLFSTHSPLRLTCDEVYGRWFSAGMVWISGVLEHNEVITEHVHLHIKLVSRITHNDKEDPLTSVFAPGLDSPVPEADGWMWMQFTHEQGRKEKKQSFLLTLQLLPLYKALIDDTLWYIRV